MNELALKYGCNPNQKPSRIYMEDGSDLPVTVLNGKPGYINFLDALNSIQLVKELKAACGLPAAASFKHVSPAGAALGLPLTDVERRMYHIVTNGDQTDTIFDLMSQGKSFADALRTRTFEPDGPNYTPRISAVVYADGSYQMSILKSADGNGDSVQRYFFDYPQPVAGEGHFISTYKHNGNPIPSFEGEPLRFACPRTIGDFAQGLWSSLNPDNKVSLFARVIDLDSGETGDMIFNKYDAVCSDLDDPEEPELLPEELELLKKLDAEEE